MKEYVFDPTRKGKTLSVSEKKLQMKLLANIMLFSDVAKKGISGDPFSITANSKMIEVPEIVKTLHREKYGMLPVEWMGMYSDQPQVEICKEIPALEQSMSMEQMERQGFGYWVNVNSNMVVEPLDHLYFDMLKKMQSLIKAKANTGSEDTRQHYRLLLYKLEQALK